MRVSTDQSDPGFTGPLGIQITLNGEPIKHVITADEEQGLVIVHKLDSEGNPLFDPVTMNMEQERLHGVVRIDLPPGHRLRQAWLLKKHLANLQAATPLPATSYSLASGGSITWTPGYSEAQMRSYAADEAKRAIALERERCASLCEALSKDHSPWDCAQEIRRA